MIGEFEQTLLLGLARCGGEADGRAIRVEIEARIGRRIAAGACYTVMDRLARRGLVSSGKGDPLPVRGGRRRRLYRLEPEGAKALAEAHREYQSLISGVLPLLVEILQRHR